MSANRVRANSERLHGTYTARVRDVCTAEYGRVRARYGHEARKGRVRVREYGPLYRAVPVLRTRSWVGFFLEGWAP